MTGALSFWASSSRLEVASVANGFGSPRGEIVFFVIAITIFSSALG